MYEHGAAKVLSTNEKEIWFAKLSDRVAMIDVNSTYNDKDKEDESARNKRFL